MKRGVPRLKIGSSHGPDRSQGPHVITYSARLDVPDDTATRLVELLAAERMRRGCGVGARAVSCSAQAILVLRWFREDADLKILAADTGISTATGYRYLHEGLDVIAAHAPNCLRAPELRAPTSSASSPTATPSSAWSAPCSPSSTTNGPKAAATSASTSSPAAASAPFPTPTARR